ncbi:MAG: hypothetical protein Alpg2KO_26280 [Alphaproteobacteria bacterium]
MSTDHANRIIAAALERANGHEGNARRMLLRAVERDHQFLYDITRSYLDGLVMKALTEYQASAADDRASLNDALSDLAMPSRPAPPAASQDKPSRPAPVDAPHQPAQDNGEPPPTIASPKHIDALRAMINAYKTKQPSDE